MFGLGLGEIIVIVIALVVFVRPKDLPRLARRLGRAYGQLRAQLSDFRETLERQDTNRDHGADTTTKGDT